MITISYRHFTPHIKSLVHFDYPYYKETGDGLGDDILGSVWSRAGNILLAGAEIPADKILTDAPKFGYRCLYCENSSQYIYAKSNAFALDDASSYEFSFWLCLLSAQSGQVLALYEDNAPALTLTVNTARQLTLSAFSSSITSEAVPLNTWHYVQIRLAADSMTILINGRNSIDDSDPGGDIQHAAVSGAVPRTALPADECRLGGFHGMLDEFMFSDTFFSSIPAEPHQAQISLQELGGTGSGALGDAVISSNITMNTTAYLSAWGSKSKFGFAGKSVGAFGDFKAGDEIMFLCLDNTDNLGKYAFRIIKSVSSNEITITQPLSEFSVIQPYTKTQILSVPHFNSLTISANAEVKPKVFADNCGGIVAFRVKNDCTIHGKILTHGTGPARTDTLQMTHAGLIDRFLVGSGGGMFIVCGGKFTLSENARLGASWAGDSKGGTYVNGSKGTGGGSGYGGGGGSDTDNSGRGGLGGVGGGGGGGDGAQAGDAGQAGVSGSGRGAAGTGGGGVSWDNSTAASAGGIQGINVTSSNAGAGTGGGGAGGNSGRAVNHNQAPAYAGANLILITKTLNADLKAVSTGGEGGNHGNNATGGGGTGFAFIACENFNS